MIETSIGEATFLAALARRPGMVAPYFVFATRLTGSKLPIPTPRIPVLVLAGTRVACLEPPETSLVDDNQQLGQLI